MADRLRDEMRKGGVDPAEHRPKEWPGWSDASKRYSTSQGLVAERADWDRKKMVRRSVGSNHGQGASDLLTRAGPGGTDGHRHGIAAPLLVLAFSPHSY
jgi:hypothetical protein